MLLLIQKKPEDKSPRRRRRRVDFQMGQILHSSGNSKTYESSVSSTTTVLLLVFLCSGTLVELVGAISTTELPLNLNVNLGSVGNSAGERGDELGESEGDVFPSSGVTDYTTPSESKFTSNGQFVRSTLTGERTNFQPSWSTTSVSTTSPPLVLPASVQFSINKDKIVVLSSSGNSKIIPGVKPSEIPAPIILQSESPLSPIVSIVSAADDDGGMKSNLYTQQLSKFSWQSTTTIDMKKESIRGTSTTAASSIIPVTGGDSPMHTSNSEEAKEKPTNINLLRKLWSSTRSYKLNLTHEHQSLLRIESEKSNSSGGGGDDKKSRSGSRSLADLSDTGESSLSLGITTSTTSTPRSISSSGTFSVELTSLRPTSLKLEAEDDGSATTIFRSRNPYHSSFDISDAPETPPVHSINRLSEDGTELSSTPSSSLHRNSNAFKVEGGDNAFPKPSVFVGNGRKTPMMLYPEWLSSGGVYPDDSTNGTGEYYGEPEYENLINNNENKGDGSSSGGNPGEREEEAPGRRMFRKRINAEFLERVANLTWQNRLRLREQQVLREAEQRETRIAASLAASELGNINNVRSTEAPEAIIAQNGLADVISRGRIDSVMYVYFGDKYNDYHKEEIAGRVIQAIGGVIAAIAQVLTVLGAAKCVRKSTESNQPPVHLHIGFALLISNLLLLLAVHATEPADVCATVAMILHYLHLVIGCWLFGYTLKTYLKLRRHTEAPDLVSPDPDNRPREAKLRMWTNSIRYSCASWSAPLPFIFMSYLANPDGYETRHYCWMSIEKGMVVSFIVPVFILIGTNTFLVVLSLRHLLAQRKLWADSSSAEMDEDSLDERKISSGIRASAMLLPLLAIMWFLGVVALENASSIFFQIASATANIALSWLVLYFLGDESCPELWCCCLVKRDQSSLMFSSDDLCSGASIQPGAHLYFDNEPLLAAASTTVLSRPSTSTSAADDGHPICSTSTASHSQSSQQFKSNAKFPVIPGPSRVTGKRQYKSSKRPNWSIPGGSEVYELKLDSISTICT